MSGYVLVFESVLYVEGVFLPYSFVTKCCSDVHFLNQYPFDSMNSCSS